MKIKMPVSPNVLIFVSMCFGHMANAQHCAPIVESYLSEVGIKRINDGIKLNFDYVKTGGQTKNSYQAYLIAYTDSDSEKIAKLTPQQAFDAKLLTVIETQLIKRNEEGSYKFEGELSTRKFVETLIKSEKLAKDRVYDRGGWKGFGDTIRIAIFIPFLEDKKYSNIDGLPEDKHECNYRDNSALLFETIPQKLSVHFGIVQAVELKEGQYYIQINGHRPVGEFSIMQNEEHDDAHKLANPSQLKSEDQEKSEPE